jgi:hypothetical protein
VLAPNAKLRREIIPTPPEQATARACDRAAIEDPPVIVKILSHLGLPTRAPPRAPARRVDLFQII